VAFPQGSPKTFFSPPTKLEKVKDPLTRLKELDFDPPYKFDLLTLATQLSLAFEYDHLLSLSNSRTNLEPYQVECVFKVINAFQQRFLIADDVGLGKTVEAGMILKELEARERAKRVLIICPAPLKPQWQRELREKFDEGFWIYDSDRVKEIKKVIPKDMNVWDYDDKIITSIDYVKQDHVLNALESSQRGWDLIIFDEAHKLAVNSSGSKVDLTDRYKVGAALADKTESLLLLTATPHKGDRADFWYRIRLLDPYIFKDADHIEPEKLNSVMIRRGKDRLHNEDGTPVFRPREVKCIPIEFTEEEMRLYNAVTQYVQEEYNLAQSLNKRAVGFAMVILQKRMVSSIAAIKASLKRRLARLQAGRPEEISERDQALYEEYLKDPDRLSDMEREELEQRLEAASLSLDPRGREIEIRKLQELIALAEAIKVDSKAQKLKQFVDGVLQNDPSEKVLIFTEYRDTLDYLRDVVLKDYKDRITEIHGLVPMEVRQHREKLFKDEMNIMLATDAAGEGINLQFCHIMVNYELPWNPNRIDQRIGRLHRYGQKRDVRVRHLLVKGTKEGEIFLRLQEKIDTIERDLGGKISEVLGTLLEGVRLEKLIMETIAGNKPIEVTQKDIERAIEERRQMIEKAQNLLMKLHKFDLQSALNVIKRSEEITFTNADIEAFVRKFFETHNGTIEPTRYKGQYRLFPPKEVLVDKLVPSKIELATFSKEIAKKTTPQECEFIAFGHPMLDQIIRFCRDRDGHFGGAATLKVLQHPAFMDKAAILFNFHVAYVDGEGKKLSEELLPILVDEGGVIDLEFAKKILRFEAHELPPVNPERLNHLVQKADKLMSKAVQAASRAANDKIARLQEQRLKEVKIRLEEAEKYFLPRIKKEEENIKAFEQRLAEGEEMAIAIRAAQSRKEKLEEEFELRKLVLEAKKEIYLQGPELLNCAALVFEQ